MGVQGIGTGNPGYSTTLEKNIKLGETTFNVYGGLGFRSNENHAHGVGGFKFGLSNGIALGFQEDGHKHSPFVTYAHDRWIAGIYVVGFKSPAFLAGFRF